MKENDDEQLIAVEGATIRDVLNKQEFDLKNMIDSIKDVATVYEIQTASYSIIVRKLGYIGFTIAYMTSKRDGSITLDAWDITPDHIEAQIERKSVIVDEKEFYNISKKYSKQNVGK